MTSMFNTTDADINMENRTFATLRAVKGSQFGRDVYTSLIKFQDLSNFLNIFPSVQRDIVPRKVGSIRKYIIGGLDKTDQVNMRFFSAVTVTCKGIIYYNDDIARMSIDTYESKLSINDGQHRFEAIRTTLETLEKEFIKSKNAEKTSRIKRWIQELNEMVVPVVIFDGLTEEEEKQLFHDLNNLAQRPSRNANIRLNQTDLFSRIAREIADENRYLKHYGVEMDKMSIFGNNPNTILLSTIYESTKELLSSDHRYHNGYLNEDSFEQVKKDINDTFSKLFTSLPTDVNVKGKYIIDKNYAIRGISKFICHARHNEDLKLSDDIIFDIIKDADWTNSLESWGKYNGLLGKTGGIIFAGGNNGGMKAVYDKLIDATIERIKTDKES